MSDKSKSLMGDVENRVEKYGWTVVGIFPDDENNKPSFTYSVGFEKTFKCPEVVFIGFDPKIIQSLIRGMAKSLKEREIQLPEDGGRISQVIQNFDVMARPVPDHIAKELARAAYAYNGLKPTRLLQICLPDKEGNLPGEDGCEEAFVSIQDYSVFEE